MEIDCAFKNICWLDVQNIYTCVVDSAFVTTPNILIKSFNGVHEPGKCDVDVEGIMFSNTVVECFPKGLFVTFPNLIFLKIERCGLKRISQRDLIGLENLKTLHLVGNQLKSLPNDLLTRMKKLERISFAANKLENVSSLLLKPLSTNGLLFVNFERNTNIDAVFWIHHSGCLGSVEQLMEVIDAKCLKPIEAGKEEKFHEKFADAFKELWATGRYSDVVVFVGTKKFLLHRFILGIQSSGFAEVFENDVQGRKAVELKDPLESPVEEFFRYFYTGEIPDDINAIKMFALAVKFNVAELKTICEERILDELDETNALEVFTLGHHHNLADFKALAFSKLRNLLPETKLDCSLMSQPELLKELVEAKQMFSLKMEEAEREFDSILQKVKTVNI